jgi:hypothetical protein
VHDGQKDREAGEPDTPQAPQTMLGRARRPPDARLPRPGMGDSAPRRPQDLRVPHPRRHAGRPELESGPQETGELPPGLPGLRSRKSRPVHGARREASARRRRDHPQPPEDPRRDQQCPALPPSAEGIRDLRPLYLGLRRRPACPVGVAVVCGHARPDAPLGRHQQGPQGAGLQVRRIDGRLLPHAGDRHGQRPPGRMLPLQGTRAATAGPGVPGGEKKSRLDPARLWYNFRRHA